MCRISAYNYYFHASPAYAAEKATDHLLSLLFLVLILIRVPLQGELLVGLLDPGLKYRFCDPAGAALLGRANLTGFVLGCIEAKVCKKICV